MTHFSRPQATCRFRIAASASLVLLALATGCATAPIGAPATAAPAPTAAATTAPATPAATTPATSSAPASASAAATSASTSAVASVATYSGPVNVLPASFGTTRVKVTADSEMGRKTGYTVSESPLVMCALPASEAPTLRKLTAARTIVLSAGETYNAQSVLEFTDPAAASAFVAEMKRIQANCPKKPDLVSATRPFPVNGANLDESVVVGSYTPNTSDGTAYFMGRKGRVVVVTVGMVVAWLAEKPQSEADHLFTAPILNVLSQV